ncbi:MAG: hypothetical protein K0R19_3406 [Bacillota bacterium]|jgi:hypothetical protein|nr:hypothetical protein [Bacillota bacterium]
MILKKEDKNSGAYSCETVNESSSCLKQELLSLLISFQNKEEND